MAGEFDRKLERYVKFIPPMYKPNVNVFVTALLKALAKSDSDVEIQIAEANKQIYVETAEGKFLDSLGSNVGVDRPLSINISDEKYRKLISTLSFKPKQVKRTMYDLLDVFWGPLFSRANITSLAQEPYDLGSISSLSGTTTFQNGSIIVNGNSSLFTSELVVGDFIKFSGDVNTNFNRVSRIVSDVQLILTSPYSGGSPITPSTGLGDFYQARSITIIVDGGSEREIFLTPQTLSDPSQATAEEIATTINAQTSTSVTTEIITASVVEDPIQESKFVNLRTNTPGPLGSLKITDGTANIFAFGVQNFVGTSAFITNSEAVGFQVGDDVVVGSSTQSSNVSTTINTINTDTPAVGTTEIIVDDDISAFLLDDDNFLYRDGDLGFNNKEILITQLAQRTVIFEVNSKELIIRIPSTVPALRRKLEGSAHIRSGWSGEIIAIDNTLKTVTVNYDLEPSQLDFFTGKTFSVQLNEFQIVSNAAGLTGVTIQFGPTDDLSVLSTSSGENGFVILDPDFRGSFIFDPQNASFSATSRRATLKQTISKGAVFPSINVEGAGDIPNDKGFVIFNFGRQGEEQPVKYRGRPNNNTLLLDPSYIFEKNHADGEIINLLVSTLKGTVPRVAGQDLAVYVTGVIEARLVVQELLRETKAAGISLRFIIDAPQYIWDTARAKLVPDSV